MMDKSVFFSIPRELRDLIYNFVIFSHTTAPSLAELPSNPESKTPGTRQHPTIACLGLFLCNRQISREVRELINDMGQREEFKYELDLLVRGDFDNIQPTWTSIPVPPCNISFVSITIRLFSAPENTTQEVDEKPVIWKMQEDIHELVRQGSDVKDDIDTDDDEEKFTEIPSEEEKEISKQRYLLAHGNDRLRGRIPEYGRREGFMRSDGGYMGTRKDVPYLHIGMSSWYKIDRQKSELPRTWITLLYFRDSGELEREDGSWNSKWSTDNGIWDYGWIWISPMDSLLYDEDYQYYTE